MTHFGIPWPVVRTAIRTVRRLFFTRDVPKQQHLMTSASIDEIRTALGKHHFAKSWKLSYHYRGEDLNMRRPEYDATDERAWKQTHVRGFEREAGEAALYAHYEYEPTEYPDAHLHAERLDVSAGVSRLSDALDAAGVRYERRPP